MLTLQDRVLDIYFQLAMRGQCAHCLRHADVSVIDFNEDGTVEPGDTVCRPHFREHFGEFDSTDWYEMLNCEEI